MQLRILYCEDDDLIRDSVVEKLESLSPKPFVIQAVNGLDGEEQFNSTRFDLIISDYDMKTKDGDGISLYKKIREKNKEINFVMLTSMEKNKFKDFFNDSHFFYIKKNDIVTNEKKLKGVLDKIGLAKLIE